MKNVRRMKNRRGIGLAIFSTPRPDAGFTKTRRGNSTYEVQIRRLEVRGMKVLHLNIHASGGSYEYAALLSAALAEQGIESRVLYKISPSAQTGRVLLDRVIRRAYVSFSTQPWHGTRRLLSPPDLRS